MTDLTVLAEPLWPYLLVIIVGFLPSEVWRILGVFSHMVWMSVLKSLFGSVPWLQPCWQGWSPSSC